MIREIQVKTLLAAVKLPDREFGMKYNMNLYRGGQSELCLLPEQNSPA